MNATQIAPLHVNAGTVCKGMFDAGTLVNGLRFHLQQAYCSLAAAEDSKLGQRDWKLVADTIVALRKTVDSPAVDAKPLLSVVAKTEQRLMDLRSSEDYFYDIARQLHDSFYQHGDRVTSFEYFDPIIQNHAEPLAESLRSGLRSALPTSVQPYFDLGYWFDQGWRRSDAYRFLRDEPGWPLLFDHASDDLNQAWNGWVAIGVDAGKLPTADTTISGGSLPEQQGGEEVECEIDLSDDSGGECEVAGDGQEPEDRYLVTRSLPPGSLAPANEWLEILEKRCQRLKLEADSDIALLRQAHAGLRTQRLSRDAWLAALARFRATLCDRLRLSFPMGHLPWRSFESDVLLYRLSLQFPEAKHASLQRRMAEHIQEHKLELKAIKGSGVSEALTRVRVYLGHDVGKRGRGRPSKAK